MKKLLSVAVCASTVAAFGSGVEVTLGEVGVTAITSSLTNIVVAVSYKDLAADDGNISVSNVIKTANLTQGDSIRVFKSDGSYDSYILEKDNTDNHLYWASTKTYTLGETGLSEGNSSIAPDVATLTAGTGFWLVRGSNWNGAETTFYIYGKPVSDVKSNVAANVATLVGNPTTVNKSPAFSVKTVGDKIYIPDPTIPGGQKPYNYTASHKWKTSGGVTSDTPPTIPAGTGFWYVPKSVSTVSW